MKASVELATLIRREKIITAVDASRTHCDSGCTLAFVAGVRRHYIHGETIQEGLSGPYYGLGFHPPHLRAVGRIPPNSDLVFDVELLRVASMEDIASLLQATPAPQ